MDADTKQGQRASVEMGVTLMVSLAFMEPFGEGVAHLAIRFGAVPGATVYQSNFSAGVDGWAGGTYDAGTAAAPTLSASLSELVVGVGAVPFNSAAQYVQKVLPVLTAGAKYQVTLKVLTHSASKTITVTPHINSSVAGDYGYGPTVVAAGSVQTVSWTITAQAGTNTFRLERGSGFGTALYVKSLLVQVTTSDLEPLTMTRTDANGTNPVRLPENAAVNSSGALDVTDSEPALFGIVSYTVRDAAGAVASATTADLGEGVIYDGTAGVLLTSVGLTGVLPVELMESYTDSRNYQQLTVNPKAVIGREDFTAAVSDDYGWTKRQGRLVLRLRGEDAWTEAEAITNLYTIGRAVLLRQTEYAGMDMYHVGKVISRDHVLAKPSGKWVWTITVEYIEIGWPGGALVGVESWTWSEVPSENPYWYTVPDEFDTWAEFASGVSSG